MRKYLREHAGKALVEFYRPKQSGSHFGLPLDSHLRAYTRQYKSCSLASFQWELEIGKS